MTANPLLEAALAYAARGWPVLPLYSPDTSHPSGCDCRRRGCGSPAKHPRTLHGLHDATTDPDLIRHWWRMWPAANVGIATGDGLVVLDVDPRHEGDLSLDQLEREHEPIWAPAVRTGGGGLHLYLVGELPARNSFRPGLDLKAAGGYVVAPPSLHASGGRYEWIAPEDLPEEPTPVPEWLRAILDPPRPRLVSGGQPSEGFTEASTASSRYLRAALEDECLSVASAPEGTRNDTLNRAAFALARLPFEDMGAVADALAISARHAGLSEFEIRRTIQSAFSARRRAA